MPERAEIPPDVLRKWQDMVDLLAEVLHVPCAAIMRAEHPDIKVFVANQSEGNPFPAGSLDRGPYCSFVMQSREKVVVTDAREEEQWRSSSDIKLGFVSYLGLPISWPGGEMFGTICVRDNKRNEYSQTYVKLLTRWRDVLEADLSALTALHEQLEVRNERIRRLNEAQLMGVFVWNLDGRIIEANDRFLQMLGYDREDFVSGRFPNWADLTPPEWRNQDFRRRVSELRTIGNLPPTEKDYLRKDGSRVPVLVSVGNFPDSRHEGVAFVLDLTERRQAEQALRDSEARFRTFADHATDALMLHDAEDGTVLDVNRYACESLGYTRDELIGMSPPEYMVDIDCAFLQHASERLKAGEIVMFEDRRRRKDGSTFPVEVRTRGFVQGGRALTISLARDISERKQAAEALREIQAELAHANRVATMGQLTASIAHEVNQPIAATVIEAQAAARWLAVDPPGLAEVRQALGRIIANGQRAGEVVERIRGLAKKGAPRTETVDLNGAVRDVIHLIRSEVLRHGVSLQMDLAPDLPRIEADRVELQQVVLNLTLNAVEAMRGVADGARVLQISSKAEADAVVVAVRDTGPGLGGQSADRLFEPFYTTKPDGMGMGLAICRSIIELHGGHLWAAANEPTGAVFHFTLPAERKEAGRVGPAIVAAIPAS